MEGLKQRWLLLATQFTPTEPSAAIRCLLPLLPTLGLQGCFTCSLTLECLREV